MGKLLVVSLGIVQTKNYKVGRLIFRDAFLTNKKDLDSRAVKGYTEVKFENTIDRITAEANPRQIERAIRDSIFGFELIYEVTDKSQAQEEDFKVILDGLKLLELDYLGVQVLVVMVKLSLRILKQIQFSETMMLVD